MPEVLMYTLKLESRCMSNIAACEDTVSFLVGTKNIKVMNEICHVSLNGMRLLITPLESEIVKVRAIGSDPMDETRFATGASDYLKIAPSHSLNLFPINNSESGEIEAHPFSK
ncbi:hypothetical protein PENTCL1PPCAC_22688 [Pristionchus entomophagus]|uniref:Transport-associated OB type 2 domain-containing protein n=1 Tax=Pristionchus entomophagus TaxID=358040 RepID=A0AAV5U0Z2_9BILA|nr:hypothetical protein PENTCL1PPCAC_22688 [Pristionchus entomophagus]